MKKVICCFLLLLFVSRLHAQSQKTYIISKDTINLRGYLYDMYGKPVPYLDIKSSQLDLEYNKYYLRGQSDQNGFFEIKGAKLNDTLTIEKAFLIKVAAIW